MRIVTAPLARRTILVIVAAALLLGVFLVATPSVEAGDATPPPIERIVPIDSDVQGGGTAGAGASEWIPFAIMLGPFSILITGILWLTFRIDRSEGRE